MPTGIAIAAASSAGDRREADTEPGDRGDADREREDEERPLGADERDQQQRREHRPGERAGGRDRVEAAGDPAGVLDVGHREAERVGRGGAEQHHRHRDQREDGEQRADERAGRDRVERVDRDVEERPGDERDDREQHRRGAGPSCRARDRRVAVGEAAAEPVADRERDEDDADRVRPDDRRGAEERRHQPRDRDLGPERAGADDEDQHVEVSGSCSSAAAQPRTHRSVPRSARAGARPGRR